jgi:hypothetical protein
VPRLRCLHHDRLSQPLTFSDLNPLLSYRRFESKYLHSELSVDTALGDYHHVYHFLAFGGYMRIDAPTTCTSSIQPIGCKSGFPVDNVAL